MSTIPYYSFLQVEDEDSSVFYQFITDHNVAYTVYFSVNEYEQYVDEFPILLQQGYAFGFRRQKYNSNDKNIMDKLVFSTIYHIILDFLKAKGKEAILLYHCDHGDERQSQRHKLFSLWERLAPSKTDLVKHSVEFEIDMGDGIKSMYLGFITASDNPLMDDLTNEFNDFSLYIIQPK